jgi:hypothetical protein
MATHRSYLVRHGLDTAPVCYRLRCLLRRLDAPVAAPRHRCTHEREMSRGIACTVEYTIRAIHQRIHDATENIGNTLDWITYHQCAATSLSIDDPGQFCFANLVQVFNLTIFNIPNPTFENINEEAEEAAFYFNARLKRRYVLSLAVSNYILINRAALLARIPESDTCNRDIAAKALRDASAILARTADFPKNFPKYQHIDRQLGVVVRDLIRRRPDLVPRPLHLSHIIVTERNFDAPLAPRPSV